MSFPPNLGITNSFIIDSSCSIFQEFPALLPHLDHICSPFSKHKMNGYSRIKGSASNRSKSLDFADLSLTRSTPPNLPKFKPTPDITKLKTAPDSIPEHDEGGAGEVFGVLLGRGGCVSDRAEEEGTAPVVKRSASIRRSASVTDGYSRIHHQSAGDGGKCGDDRFSSHVKKKGKFFRAFRRLFGL